MTHRPVTIPGPRDSGLVNLPSRRKHVSKFLVLAVIAIAILAFLVPAQQLSLAPSAGGNGGLVNLPGGGVASTGVGTFIPGQQLNTSAFTPVAYVVGQRSVVVLGLYNDYIVFAKVSPDGTLVYQATYTASGWGGQIISRWYCTCHPGVQQEVVTDCNGSIKPERYQAQHDERLAAALHAHPAKTEQ